MVERTLPGPIAESWILRDGANVSPSYTRAYPFVMARGRGVRVWDVDGNEYLDFTSGIAVTSTGHCHPEVVAAIKEQVDLFLHMSGTDFYYPQQVELAETLNRLVPISEPTLVFFTNSGAESVEAAIKLARYATGRPHILAFRNAFHGRTMGALSLTASKVVQRRGFAPLLPEVTHVNYAYCYRCPLHLTFPECEVACVREIEEELFRAEVPPDQVAAIFVEPIQGEGGYIVPPKRWMQALRELCDRHGILLVADEVQTGFGRTGKMFAMEHFDVEPDIVAVAKGIASGMPLGAIIARRSLMSWPPGAHASTFGGNPVSCVAALATIRLLEDGLVDNAARMGAYMMDRLREMQERHPSMGDVRGLGLMIGVEMVRDRETKARAREIRDWVIQRAFEKGLLILGAGVNVVRFMPPLIVTERDIDIALGIFEETLTEAEREVLGVKV